MEGERVGIAIFLARFLAQKIKKRKILLDFFVTKPVFCDPETTLIDSDFEFSIFQKGPQDS
ncbi:hypothetical protein DLM78_10450 [Leptospira stimsonii]|uniref:Uncharacterized protein n=1 Tax=Leptospira stimsonii TaxID=2202203 RepID=A0A8B6RYI4_9LEPT|nr:hypothetical protein DLM78_10450 [Leptospira stimsonii]